VGVRSACVRWQNEWCKLSFSAGLKPGHRIGDAFLQLKTPRGDAYARVVASLAQPQRACSSLSLVSF
jgi:hypothetical protein